MHKIILTGPESTGKTTLAQALAEKYQTIWIPEFAREYLEKLPNPYQQDDLRAIAKGQIGLEEKGLSSQKSFLFFCDTDLLTIKIWSTYKYGTCDAWILEQLQKRLPTLYILCGIDIPWEFDPLRESPDDRAELYEIYKNNILKMQTPYVEVIGDLENRMQQIHRTLQSLEIL